ncbi:Uncharacterised protein [BD1-7 clade bacterium]|uniref:Thioesterase domain-containing protein n=1 Tax=BD1-7 clade bacterium TaxID=2029982 RepID=A0A5S9Q0C7_9GAMM|nr:Uncharacterised protein [BD1-7 clade bacterium]CAA0112347.1 Uncharacterised protein [BD1-7 clade bacterium]
MFSTQRLNTFFSEMFPESGVVVESVGTRSARMRMCISRRHLRPGDTVSGPAMMELADALLHAAILGELGLEWEAVTTNLNINFLRSPLSNKDLVGHCSLIKVGRTQIVGEANIYSDGFSEPVAHAVGTYAIPVER